MADVLVSGMLSKACIILNPKFELGIDYRDEYMLMLTLRVLFMKAILSALLRPLLF